MAQQIRLLGFVPAVRAQAVRAAIESVPGGAVHIWVSDNLAAMGQAESSRAPWTALGRTGLLAGLRTVQMRLERACLASAFLPMDPAAALLAAPAVRGLLETAAADLADCLAETGDLHQWDVVLRWPAEAIVAARRAEIAAAVSQQGAGHARAALAQAVAEALAREHAQRRAALHGVLAQCARRVAELGGGPAETGCTVLIPAGRESVIETALALLPAAAAADATVDMRGPLPPLSFAAVRLVQAEPGDIARAWRLLALPALADAAALRQAWVCMAARVHPDHAGAHAPGTEMAAANQAYHLLRTSIGNAADGAAWTMRDVQRRARRRLAVPARLPEMAA